MTSVTDEHRKILAEEFTSRGFDDQATMALNGELDRHPNMQLITRCHQAGMIEGARLMREAAIEAGHGTIYAHRIKDIDPEAIVKGKSDD